MSSHSPNHIGGFIPREDPEANMWRQLSDESRALIDTRQPGLVQSAVETLKDSSLLPVRAATVGAVIVHAEVMGALDSVRGSLGK